MLLSDFSKAYYTEIIDVKWFLPNGPEGFFGASHEKVKVMRSHEQSHNV